MKVFKPTKRDNERGIMRLELNAEDIDILESTAYRLGLLAVIERTLDAVALQSPSFLGEDIQHVTLTGAALLQDIVDGWDPLLHAVFDPASVDYFTDGVLEAS